MRRLWLRWVGLVVLAALLVAVMVRLGEWQVHRLEGRRAANASIRTNRAEPPVAWTQLFGGPIGAEQQWRHVTVTGTFDTAHQLQVRYRSLDGDQGSEVLTPIRTADGRHVLVDRGFLPRSSSSGDDQALPAPPSGTVTVRGYVKGDENGDDSAVVPVQGKVRLINSAAISKAQGIDYPPGHIVAQSMTPAQTSALHPIGYPELDEGPHLSYAIQWFCFCVIAGVGVVILIRADVRDRRRAQERRQRRRRTESATSATAGAARPPREDSDGH